MLETESDRGDAAVVRLDLVAPPGAPAAPATTTSSGATTTATTCDEDGQEEDGFTFAAVTVAVPGPQDADCAIPDAQVSPVYPVFGRARWSQPEQQHQQEEDPAGTGTGTAPVRMPLGRLLLQDRWCDYAPSPSRQQQQPADAADGELDGVPAETYCLWSPGASPAAASAESRRSSPARCPKNGSPGSPVLRWRLRRQRVVVSPSHSDGGSTGGSLVLLGTSSVPISASEGLGRWMNRGSDARGGGKSRTAAFLPSKRDLVGLVASAVAFPRSYLPF